jgi:signal transduction histidine kinase
MLLNYLMSDILDFSRLYSNEFQLHCTYFNLETVLASIKNLFKDQALQKGLSIAIKATAKAKHVM